jgi:hemin uptake protein HemP
MIKESTTSVPSAPAGHVDSPADPPPARTGKATVLDSSQLFQGAREVMIRHGNETYRLRQTQAGKLILTK